MKQINNRFQIVFLLTIIFTVVSCEKEIDLDLPPFEPKIVIEGVIENDEYAWVFLSRNQGYLDEFEVPRLDSTATIQDYMDFMSKYLVTDATIIVSDGIVNDTLEFGINPDIIMSGTYIYPPVKYIGKKFKGQVGKQYSLTVLHEGQTYTSSTTVPKPFVEDTVWYYPDPNEPGFGGLRAKISDDPSEANYYTYFCKREEKDKFFTRGPASMALWDDKLFSGLDSVVIPVMRGENGGYDQYKEDNEEEQRLFKEGDSVTIKVCTMDNSSYRFWKTATSSGSSFMGQPAAVQSNINPQGSILGVWCGYGTRYVGVRCNP